MKREVKCEVCNKILMDEIDIYTMDGHTLCVECYNDTVGYCPYCGKRILYEDEPNYGLNISGYAICLECLTEYDFVFCLDLLIWAPRSEVYVNSKGEYFYRETMKKSPWLD